MQYPDILKHNKFFNEHSTFDSEMDWFAKALCSFMEDKPIARPFSAGFEDLVGLLGDLYGYQEYTIWDAICPQGDAFKLMQLLGQSKSLTEDDLLSVGEPLFSTMKLSGKQQVLVFDDMHDGAYIFKKLFIDGESFHLQLLHHTHSEENAIDIAKRLIQEETIH